MLAIFAKKSIADVAMKYDSWVAYRILQYQS